MVLFLKMRSSLSKGDRSNRGFSLLEIMVALGISSVVLAGATAYLFYFFNQHSLFDQWSGVHQDSYVSLEKLQNDLRNVISLSPVEDLRTIVGDKKYFGLASLTGAEVPGACLNNADFNAIRVTTLNRKKIPEKTLRLWDESISSGLPGAAHEIRISADATASSLFQAGYTPKEIVLVDADRLYTRRYEVVSATLHLGTTIDPTDDVNKAPTIFNYARVHLKNPKDLANLTNPKKVAVFVTSSEVFDASTSVYCVDSADKIVKGIDTTTGTAVNLFEITNNDFLLKSFRFVFAKTHLSARLEDSSFSPNIFAPSLLGCANVVKFKLELTPTAGRLLKLKAQNIAEGSANIKRSRTLFLPNLQLKRAVGCTL
jgi:prepilin-type N-terminal cleavage/methylation domain-containing protein